MNYLVFIPTNKNRKLSIGWLWLAVTALGLAGILSILLVIARTPSVQTIIPVSNLFQKSLVVHVDLSVIIWFLSMYGLMISGSTSTRFYQISRASIGLSFLAIAMIFISPFMKNAEPILNNYIPVIDNKIFYLGLQFFIFGIFAQTIIFLISRYGSNFPKAILDKPNYYLLQNAGYIFILFTIELGLSYYKLARLGDLNLSSYEFYEYLFWGPVHLLQFLFVQILVAASLSLGYHLRIFSKINNNLLKLLNYSHLIFAFITLIPYFLFEINSYEFLRFFTLHMIILLGLFPSLIYFLLIYGIVKNFENLNKYRSNLASYFYCSLFLFFYGGILGLLIKGVNVVIPAHYHGSIVGISIALMGIALYYLKNLKGMNLDTRWIFWQPIIYSIGQIMHISGLALSGGYGVLRKDPNLQLSIEAKTYMGLMGLGGLISIIGGIIFILLALKGLLAYRRIYAKTRFRTNHKRT